MGEDPSTIEGRIEDTREHMGDTVAALSHKADVPGRVKESVSEKTSAVTGKLSSARDSIVGTTGDVTSGAQDGSRRAVGIAKSNPLGLAIGAAALGFVVGTLLPTTEAEEQRVGPIATQVRGQLTDVASEAIDHGKDVAQDAVEAAAQAAKESGKDHAEQLQHSAQETLSTD